MSVPGMVVGWSMDSIFVVTDGEEKGEPSPLPPGSALLVSRERMVTEADVPSVTAIGNKSTNRGPDSR